MTKSTITRERLEKIKSWRETYGAGSNVMLPAEEAEKLALIALAAMDSEPMAYIFKHPAGRLFWSLTDKSNKGHDDVMPVYASPQPAPIVEREPIAWLNDAYLARGVVDGEAGSEDAGPGYIPVYRHAQPAPVVPEEWTIADAVKFCKETGRQDAGAAMDAWNSCRAAMLQAGNSPVIPESCSAQFGNFQHYWHSKGYVMVPKEPTEAMCDISHIGVDVYCGITDDNEYYSIGGAEAAKVWKAMLAAAPQEVK